MGEILKQVLSTVLGSILFSGSQGNANDLIKSQTRLSNQAADIFGQQSAMDLPYRASTMNALTRRSQQQFPRILPQAPGAALNPLAGGRTPQYPMQGANSPPPQRDFQAILRALMAGRR